MSYSEFIDYGRRSKNGKIKGAVFEIVQISSKVNNSREVGVNIGHKTLQVRRI